MGERQQPPGFLAPLLASSIAPLAQAVRRTIASTLATPMTPGSALAEVTCPHCHAVVTVWAAQTRCLYPPPPGNGLLGPPLEADFRAEVTIGCDHCRVTLARTSGRAVGYRIRRGKPPLP